MAAGKYYWLKLKRDFFKRHDIRIIEEMPNGKDYILFYLKLLLESIDHEGNLRFSDSIPYDNKMLSVITNTNIDIVKSAMDIFIALNMVEIYDDNTIYMAEVNRLIGSETANAQRVRKHRENKKALQCNTNVTKCNIEKEIDKDKDKEKDKELEKESREKLPPAPPLPFHIEVLNLYNSICDDEYFPYVEYITDTQKSAIDSLQEKYSLDKFKLLFEKTNKSDFLKGENKQNWFATFDWLVKEENLVKVLNGNFDTKKGKGVAYDLDWFEEMLNKDYDSPPTAADDESIRERAEALKKELAEKY